MFFKRGRTCNSSRKARSSRITRPTSSSGARRLSAEDRTTVARITEYERIISFRNILIHGYAEVDGRIVWDVLQTKLPTLLQEVAALLDEK